MRPAPRSSQVPLAAATSRPAAALGASAAAAAGAVATSSSIACTQVAAVEKTAPAVHAWASAGSARARAPMNAVVAVLETKPDSAPEPTIPALGPSSCRATWPAACSTRISVIKLSSVRGARPASQGSGVVGASGSSTSTSAASIRASCRSASLGVA